jgi:hypothetical protein
MHLLNYFVLFNFDSILVFKEPAFPLYKEKVSANFSNKDYVKIATTIDDIHTCYQDLDGEFEEIEEGCFRTKFLNVEGNQIEDLTNLDDYDFLESVNLSRNKLTHLSSYRTPKTLIFMDCSSNQIEHLQKVKEMNLRFLNLSKNELKSLAGIESIPNLVWFSASHNHLKSMDGIENLKFLRWGFFSNNSLTSISLLPRCAFLLEIDLSNNKLMDEKEIIGLIQFTQVQSIDLTNNLFSTQQKQNLFQFAANYPTRKIVIKL